MNKRFLFVLAKAGELGGDGEGGSDLGQVNLTFPPIYILFHFSQAALGVVEPQGFPKQQGDPIRDWSWRDHKDRCMAKRSVHLVLHQCLYIWNQNFFCWYL